MRRLIILTAFLICCSGSVVCQYSIQQYLSIRSASGPTFSPDGKSLAYLTNATGTTQIWVVDLSKGKPRQLTNYDDNVGFVRWLGDGSGLIFGKANGGDENTQFFFIKADGTGFRQLTDEPGVRHNFSLVSDDGKTIAYASNKRNRQFFDIYSMNIADGKETLLYQNDGNNDIAAMSSNGTKIVISRDGTELSLDNDLYLIDLRTKSEIHITPHSGSAEFGNVHFVADGIVFTHNNDREFISLAQMRKRNASGDDWSDANREVSILDDASWDVDDVAMNQYGSIIAYTLNREGFSELYLRKYETDGKPLITVIDKRSEQVKLPARGIVGSMNFNKDQSKLAFSFSSPTQNSDVWVYDLKSKALKQITHSDRAGIDAKSFVAPELVKFKTFDGREIPAWFYLPSKSTGFRIKNEGESDELASYVLYESSHPEVPARPLSVFVRSLQPMSWLVSGVPRIERKSKAKPGSFKAVQMPVVVSVHGGPEGQERPGFSGLYQYYLSRGYAILATNVRGSTGYGKTYTHLDDVKNRENSVKDLAAAVEWLKTSGAADPKKIAVMGGSYGGYMTLAAITLYPDLWAAAVDTVGISNWETFLKNTSGYRRRQREVEYGRLDRDIDFLRSISPIAKIDRIKCPLFVIAGKNDPRVPWTEGQQIVDALKNRRAVVEWKLYDDEGHGISKLKNRLDLYPRVADFLDKYLK